MKKIYLPMIAIAVLTTTAVKSQNIFSENFDDVPTILSSGGWTQINNSVPLGAEIWHNGTGLGLPAYNGAADAFAEVSFQSTDASGAGDINNWLITPPITVDNGDVVSFYTAAYNNATYPDRLELRLNPLNTTNVGTTPTDTGDFSILLVSVNPDLVADTSTYPQGYWGQFTATISGLSGPTSVRLAFRYFVPNGGGTGANSSTIGVDALSVDMPSGVSQIENQFEVNLYPNPLTERGTVNFGKPLSENGVVYVINTLGQTDYSFRVSKGQTKASFNLKDLAQGTYTLMLETSQTVLKKMLVKN